MENTIKLAIVDDDNLFRSVLAALIKPHKGIEIIMSLINGQELINALPNQTPDIVILDLEMPVMDGIKTTDFLCEKYPDIKILILTGHTNEELFNYLIRKGVNGFLPKKNNFAIIIEAIYSIEKNGYYFANLDLKKITAAKKIKKTKPISLNEVIFSTREIEVLQLICQQHTNKEISEKLFISARTVDGHRNKLLQKANVRNSVGLVVFAVKNNLINKDFLL
jgi:DNA-binding NarL/FixJ family response regulator